MRRRGEDDGRGGFGTALDVSILGLWRISTWAFWVGCYSTRLQRYHSE